MPHYLSVMRGLVSKVINGQRVQQKKTDLQILSKACNFLRSTSLLMVAEVEGITTLAVLTDSLGVMSWPSVGLAGAVRWRFLGGWAEVGDGGRLC